MYYLHIRGLAPMRPDLCVVFMPWTCSCRCHGQLWQAWAQLPHCQYGWCTDLPLWRRVQCEPVPRTIRQCSKSVSVTHCSKTVSVHFADGVAFLGRCAIHRLVNACGPVLPEHEIMPRSMCQPSITCAEGVASFLDRSFAKRCRRTVCSVCMSLRTAATSSFGGFCGSKSISVDPGMHTRSTPASSGM